MILVKTLVFMLILVNENRTKSVLCLTGGNHKQYLFSLFILSTYNMIKPFYPPESLKNGLKPEP